MGITAEMVAHPYGPTRGCAGGDDCDHTETISSLADPGPDTRTGPDQYVRYYTAQIEALARRDPRIADGHVFNIRVW